MTSLNLVNKLFLQKRLQKSQKLKVSPNWVVIMTTLDQFYLLQQPINLPQQGCLKSHLVLINSGTPRVDWNCKAHMVADFQPVSVRLTLTSKSKTLMKLKRWPLFTPSREMWVIATSQVWWAITRPSKTWILESTPKLTTTESLNFPVKFWSKSENPQLQVKTLSQVLNKKATIASKKEER